MANCLNYNRLAHFRVQIDCFSETVVKPLCLYIRKGSKPEAAPPREGRHGSGNTFCRTSRPLPLITTLRITGIGHLLRNCRQTAMLIYPKRFKRPEAPPHAGVVAGQKTHSMASPGHFSNWQEIQVCQARLGHVESPWATNLMRMSLGGAIWSGTSRGQRPRMLTGCVLRARYDVSARQLSET